MSTRIMKLFTPDSTIEEVQHIIDTTTLMDDLNKVIAVTRCRGRGVLKNKGYSEEIIKMLLPLRQVGRPVSREYSEVFPKLHGSGYKDLVEALGATDDEIKDPTWWTCDRVNTATNSVMETYKSPTYKSVSLSAFRNGLRNLGVPPAIVIASARPAVTAEHIRLQNIRAEQLDAEGVNMPEEFTSVENLEERVRGYIADADFVPSADSAIDFMLALSARPGELTELELGPSGGISGSLKKRGNGDIEFPIQSMIDTDLAKQFVEKWSATPKEIRLDAGRTARKVLKTKGVKTMSMVRKFGAYMAGEVQNPKNQAQRYMIEARALRHKITTRPATLHYGARINKPEIDLPAEMDDLIQEIEKIS